MLDIFWEKFVISQFHKACKKIRIPLPLKEEEKSYLFPCKSFPQCLQPALCLQISSRLILEYGPV